MKRAANIDRNHTEIRLAFEGLGCSVQPLHQIGKGCPDLLVGVPGSPAFNLLVEVKGFPAHTEKGKLNPDQEAWHAWWNGQVAVVRSLEDVGRLIKSLKTLMEFRLPA